MKSLTEYFSMRKNYIRDRFLLETDGCVVEVNKRIFNKKGTPITNIKITPYNEWSINGVNKPIIVTVENG